MCIQVHARTETLVARWLDLSVKLSRGFQSFWNLVCEYNVKVLIAIEAYHYLKIMVIWNSLAVRYFQFLSLPNCFVAGWQSLV